MSRRLEDGFGEILAVDAIQPSGAHNDVLTARRHNGLFALKFCAAIDASWRARLVFSARSVVGFRSKHIVRGNVKQPRLRLLSDLCHIVHSLVVEQVCQFLLSFGGIYVGEGSTVDDYFDVVLRHHLRQGRFVGDVKGIDVGAFDIPGLYISKNENDVADICGART